MIMDIREYINEAIQKKRDITIKYKKYDGSVSTRVLSNVEYSDEYGDSYIKAYCHLRHENRTFKINRIIEVDGISNYYSSCSNRTYTPSAYASSSNYSSLYTRSQSNRTKKNEGCYIATMAYGNYNHPQVIVLRRYRDQVLSNSIFGRYFIYLYYIISPKLVIIFHNKKSINHWIRMILDKHIRHICNRYHITPIE